MGIALALITRFTQQGNCAVRIRAMRMSSGLMTVSGRRRVMVTGALVISSTRPPTRVLIEFIASPVMVSEAVKRPVELS